MTGIEQALKRNNIVPRAEGEAGNVFYTVFADHQDIVFAVAAGAGQTLRQGQHRLHRYHHTRFEYRVDIFTQLEARFASIVMLQHTEGMPVTKGAILQQIELFEEAVDLGADSRTGGTRADQGYPEFMRIDIGLPDFQ